MSEPFFAGHKAQRFTGKQEFRNWRKYTTDETGI